jgi:hypothetical protein
MRSAIAQPTIVVVDPASLLRALEVYELDRLDFAEAYLVALAEATGVGEIVSFDSAVQRAVQGRAQRGDLDHRADDELRAGVGDGGLEVAEVGAGGVEPGIGRQQALGL